LRALSFLKRFGRVTLAGVAGVARAAVVLSWVARGLRHGSFEDLVAALGLHERRPAADAARVARAQQLVRWAHRIVPFEPNCLLDSLAAAALLHRQGYSVPLLIGVKVENNLFQAHAWLGEENPEGGQFQNLYRIPQDAAGSGTQALRQRPG
jgi:hypothetical protein